MYIGPPHLFISDVILDSTGIPPPRLILIICSGPHGPYHLLYTLIPSLTSGVHGSTWAYTAVHVKGTENFRVYIEAIC